MAIYYPTSFFRYVRRDTAAPCMVLQQWWSATLGAVQACIPPETNGWSGEWRDVPIVEPDLPTTKYVLFEKPINVRNDEVLEYDSRTGQTRTVKD